MIAFEEYFDDFENSYDKLYDIIVMYQKEFCAYVLSMPIGHKNVMEIIMLIKELCENEKVDFNHLYHWILNQMFCGEFFDYSFSYQFVNDLLLLENSHQVFTDIVNKMDVNNSLSIRIAVSSMYQHDELFRNYPQIGYVFCERVKHAIKKDKTLMKEVRLFLKPVFRLKNFRKYQFCFEIMAM